MRDKVDTLVRYVPEVAVEPRASHPTLCLLNGTEAGRVIPLRPGRIVIGRSEDAGLTLPHEDVSRHHAELVVLADGKILVADADSTNGTWVNGNRISRTHYRLEDGDRLRVGDTLLKLVYQDVLEQRLQQSLYDAAAKDALTGAYNKRYLAERLDQEFAYSVRHATPLALVLFDLDHFKRVNDCYGHVAGDAVLRDVARRVQASIRQEDVFARYGGEEFAIVMRETTAKQADVVVQRLSRRLAASPIDVGGASLTVTISTGVAERIFGAHGSPEELIHRADELLYAAKAAGRNCIRLEGAA